MKQRFIHFSKSTMSVILSVCMLVSCLTVGLIATDAAQVTESGKVGATADSESVGAETYFKHVYFAVPDSWVMTGVNVYLALIQTNDYTRFLKMDQIGSTNLYYLDGNGVGSWSDEETLDFVTSATNPGNSTTNNITTFSQYTELESYRLTSSMRYYAFKLTDGGSLSKINVGIDGKNDTSSQLACHIGVTVNVTTDGVAGYTGGDVQVVGQKLKDEHELEDATESIETNDASGDPVFYGAMGTPVTLTAQPNEGYVFAGFYDANNETLVSNNESYTYNLYERTVYARFVTDTTPKYYVTSAGKTDSDKGFTDNIWAPKDADGKMTETAANSGIYTKTFNNLSMGSYRFKVNGFSGNNSLGSWGGAKVTYTNDEGTNACIVDRSTENSGNAKFRLTKKSNVTVTFNTATNAITVTAAAVGGASQYEYYVVGMASDGTAGMFGNVWADDWKEFSSVDKMTESSTGVWTKTYTNFGGTYGTYSYKIATTISRRSRSRLTARPCVSTPRAAPIQAANMNTELGKSTRQQDNIPKPRRAPCVLPGLFRGVAAQINVTFRFFCMTVCSLYSTVYSKNLDFNI